MAKMRCSIGPPNRVANLLPSSTPQAPPKVKPASNCSGGCAAPRYIRKPVPETRAITAIEVAVAASIDNGLTSLFEIKIDHFERITYLMKKYRDLPMDLADASLVILAETIGEGGILSTDRRDFHTYRWKERKPFQNLL